jgi:hypothetical protein
MKNLKSDLFQKFENQMIEENQTVSVTGGINVGGGVGVVVRGGDTRVTGDTDCTGDYISPDCGDGSSTNTDSTPTSSNDDGCY